MAAARAHALALSASIACTSQLAFSSPLALDAGEAAQSFTLELRASYRQSDLGDRETLGLIVLSVPLERLSASKAPPPRAAPSPTDAGAGARTSTEPRAPESEPAVELVPLVTPELARAAVRAALAAAGKRAARARLDSLEGRARTSALLPELSLRAARTTDESLRLTPTADDPYRYTQAGAAALLFEARVAWKLSRLAFADEELAVERLRGERARVEAALIEKVLSALFKWQKALVLSADPLLDPEQRVLHAIAAAEAEVVLDVLTAGWFARAVKVERSRPQRTSKSRPSSERRALRVERQGASRSRTGKTAPPGVEDRRNARRNP
jgi:hypothetical protein